jgi:hypothetical protein
MVKEEEARVDVDREQSPDPRTAFEAFTSGPSWRELPLKIKLMVLHLWRSERDTLPSKSDD